MGWLMTVLAGVVGTLLGIVIVGAALWFGLKWWISRKLSGLVDGLKGMAQAADCVQPFRLKLHPGLDEDWNVVDAEDLIADLQQNGFVEAGDFHTEESPSFCFSLKGFALLQKSVWAALYHHPQAGMWIDMVSYGVDKSSVCVTSLADHGMDSPDYVRMEFHPQASVGQLLSRIEALRDETGQQPQAVNPSQFQAVFCQAYDRSLDWRIARGGPTAEEILRQADRNGVQGPQREQLVQMVQMQWRARISEFYEEQLAERFMAAAQISPGKWAKLKRQILFVHDSLTGHELTTRCSQLLIGLTRDRYTDADDEFDSDDEEEGFHELLEQIAEISATGPARQVFPQIEEALACMFKFTRVGTLNKPVPADVYKVERAKSNLPGITMMEE